MKRIVEVVWKIGDERGVSLENLKKRIYRFEVPKHWNEESGWTNEDIIQAGRMELARDAYNVLGILETKVLSAELKETDEKKK